MTGTYNLPTGYVSRTEYVQYADAQTGTEWQPDVLTHAANIARDLGASTIVDVGCGQARKLIPLVDEFDVVGVDMPSTVAGLPDTPGATWVGHDLTEPLPPEAIVSGSVAVCSDVIEHVVDAELFADRFNELLKVA